MAAGRRRRPPRRVPSPARDGVGRRPRVGPRRAGGVAPPARRRPGIRTGRGSRPDAVAEPYRLQLAGRFDDGRGDAGRGCPPRTTRRWPWSTPARRTSTRAGLDLLDRLGADASPARSARTCGAAASRPSRRAGAEPRGRTRRAHRPPGRGPRACSPTARPTPRSPSACSSRTKTVDHHVSAILSKLQVASRRDAVRRGTELGILDRPAAPVAASRDGTGADRRSGTPRPPSPRCRPPIRCARRRPVWSSGCDYRVTRGGPSAAVAPRRSGSWNEEVHAMRRVAVSVLVVVAAMAASIGPAARSPVVSSMATAIRTSR